AAGDVRVRWSPRLLDMGEAWPLLLAALEQAGYERIDPADPCTFDESAACMLRRDDRRVHLDAWPSYPGSEYARVELHLLPAGHQPLSRLPGKCVTPPQRARPLRVHSMGIDQDGEMHQGETRWGLRTDPGPDLDGDGVPEIYVPHPTRGHCPWDVPHDVYVMRGACGHHVGTITGTIDDQTALAPFAHGLREVETTAEWAAHDGDGPVPQHHTRTRRYRFDGARLRKVDDQESVGVCHHCGVAHCRPE
ncbi:MAG: hypothetical protein KDK70_21320, partial [Myxococcales bacterium]|nr:hypothetical protein [Myxococcales bacterium]